MMDVLSNSLLELAKVHVVNVCIDKLIWAVLQSDPEKILSHSFPSSPSLYHITLQPVEYILHG